MLSGERESFNAALSRLQTLEELQRVSRKLEYRANILGAPEARDLLRKVEALL